MLDPIQVLNKIKSSLSNNGLIYIATPDMLHPRTDLRDYDDWLQYWFRAPHTYYFSRDTLHSTLKQVELISLNIHDKDNEEVWCLATKDNTNKDNYSYQPMAYNKQLNILRKLNINIK
jgi:hypothetical protein